MTCLCLPFALGLGVRTSSNLKVFEDADGHQLPMRRRTDADADGRKDAPGKWVVATYAVETNEL